MKRIEIGHVVFDGRFIIIKVSPVYDYDILLERCRTPEDLRFWEDHLSEKCWGPDILSDFRAVVGAITFQ